MANLAAALKSEITRLARKEMKGELLHLRKQIASQRAALAALRKKVAELERHTKRPNRAKVERAAEASGAPSAGRFSAKGVKSLREKLGLSAADFGKLAGVTGTTVYNWEGGKARPQRAQLEGLQALRGMGKRAASAKLEELP